MPSKSDIPPSTRIIRRHHLQAFDLDEIRHFYLAMLGMNEFPCPDGQLLMGYDYSQCCLEFCSGARRAANPALSDFYWKIGITLADLDAAVYFLQQEDVAVTSPRQFKDIGYMSKVTDPAGLVIELLQRGFKGNHRPVSVGHPIGVQAALAHLTFRVSNIAAARQFFEHVLSMRLMSVQPVPEYAFCLYFYAWSDEALPCDSLEAVENREWLWSRPYAMIELQHLQEREARVQISSEEVAGFRGISVSESDADGESLQRIDASALSRLAD